MEIVYIIHGVRVRVITGSDPHVTAFLPVRADVFPQRCRFLEAAVAEGAAAGSLSGVDELVVFEVLQAAQALPADGAHVGFLSGVCAPVLSQTVQVAEAISTLRARVRLLARVYAQVGLKRPGLAEATAADSTWVGLLSSVDADVLLQAGDKTERLSTFQAVVRPISRGFPCCVRGRRSCRVLCSAW